MTSLGTSSTRGGMVRAAMRLGLVWVTAAMATEPALGQVPFSWTTNADNTITVTKYTGDGGAVAIPDKINGLPVAGIGYKAFCLCTNLTGVTIPNGVTNIGYKAFHRCTNLTGVTIPDSVTSIEGMAFRDCHSLTNITIGPNVTNIGVMVFEGVNRPRVIEVDPLNPVYASVDGVLFDKRQTRLNADNTIAFTRYTGGDEAMAIPGKINGRPVTSIGSNAFDSCRYLTNVTIPASVTDIGKKAFFFCTSLKNVTIPGGVTNIGHMAFAACSSLTAITVDPMNPVYSGADGVLFDKRQTTLIQYPGTRVDNFTIPSGVTSIGNGAFRSCTSLTNVTIGSSVTNIGDGAFSGCAKLTDVTIPASVTSIGDSAFPGCASLTGVTIPASVTSMGNEVFSLCERLTSVTIGSSVPDIGDRAFSRCTSLGDVTIPASVTNIGSGAFRNCNQLTNVVIGPRVASIGDEVFSGCSKLTSVTIPSSVTSIGERVFANCKNLEGVYFKGDAPSPSAFVFDVASTATVYYLERTKGWEDWFGGRPTVVWKTEGQTNSTTGAEAK